MEKLDMNALKEEKEFLRSGDSEQLWNVSRSQSTHEYSDGNAQPLDCRTTHGTRSREDISVLARNCHETWRRIETRAAEFKNTDSTIFQEILMPDVLRVVLEKLFLKIV